MPDVFGVYDDMKVWEYLDFFARCYGIPAARRRRMIGDLLELVDLADKRDSYVQGLSRGMQQRLCLAHTLVHDPLVLLLDEPASGLDPRARVELRELLRELRSLGKTILICSHILPELEELCTSVAIIDRGQVLAQGRSRTSSSGCGSAPSCASGSSATRGSIEAADAYFASQPDVASVGVLDDGTIEIGFRGDDAASARLLAAAVGAGIQVVELRPRRERPRGAVPPGHRPARELGSVRPESMSDAMPIDDAMAGQVPGSRPRSRSLARSRTSHGRRRADAVGRRAATAAPQPHAARRHADAFAGLTAVGVKELRGRMRGRRAFVILTSTSSSSPASPG